MKNYFRELFTWPQVKRLAIMQAWIWSIAFTVGLHRDLPWARVVGILVLGLLIASKIPGWISRYRQHLTLKAQQSEKFAEWNRKYEEDQRISRQNANDPGWLADYYLSGRRDKEYLVDHARSTAILVAALYAREMHGETVGRK